MKRLIDHQSHRVTLHNSTPSDVLVITFGHHGAAIADRGFASDFCEKKGFNHIYACCEDGTQFQTLSHDEFTKAVLPECVGKRVFTYGVSLGGYAALYYASGISATAIAFSPRNSAHPVITAGDAESGARFKGLSYQHERYNWMATNCAPFIIYDPWESLDQVFLREVVQPIYPLARVTEMHGAGHYTPNALSKRRLLGRFIDEIVCGGTAPDVSGVVPPDFGANKARYLVSQGDHRSAIGVAHSFLVEREWESRDGFMDALAAFCASVRITKSMTHVDRAVKSVVQESSELTDYFDEDLYLRRYADVRASSVFSENPLFHYLIFGCFEGRSSGTPFNAATYLEKYRDVRLSGQNPYLHYIRYGRRENRVAGLQLT